MTPAVLLDMDGVVLRGRATRASVYERAARSVLEDSGVDPDADTLELLVDPPSAEAVRDGLTKRGLEPDTVWRRREHRANEIAIAGIDDGERRFYDDIDVIEALDVPVGLVSNNRHGTVQHVADQLPAPVAIARGRDPTLAGFDRLKPDSYYLERALASLGSDRAIYVGDRHTDVTAAAGAGLPAILLEREDGDPGSPGNHEPVARIESLEGLPAVVRRVVT